MATTRSRGGILWSRQVDSPSASKVDHPTCRCTKPGIIPWAFVVALSLALFSVSLGRLAIPGLDWLPDRFTPGWPVAVTWLALAIDILLVLLLLGWHVNCAPRGLFIVPNRFVVSLAYVQAIFWLVLFTSCTLTLLVLGFGQDGSQGLNIDGNSGLQLGVSVGAAVGGAAALAAKGSKLPDGPAADLSTKRLLHSEADRAAFSRELLSKDGGQPSEDVVADAVKVMNGTAKDTGLLAGKLGIPANATLHEATAIFDKKLTFHVHEQIKDHVLYRNLCPCEARFLDTIEGDEIVNARSLDIGKVQFLLASLLGLAVFAVALWSGFMQLQSLADDRVVGAYPRELVEALGLSGAGYAGSKLPTRTGVTP